MKGIAILGSTGSVGVSTLDVLARHADRYRVVALGAQRSSARLLGQALRFRPEVVALAARLLADGIESVLVHPFHQLFAKTLPANRVHEDVDLLRNIQSSHLEVPSAFGKLCLPPLLLSINIADWHTSKQENTI